MIYDSALKTLAIWLAGRFDNRAQALEQPAWFVHLQLWQRPIPGGLDGRPALFVEQANALTLERPYRQRILVLEAGEKGDRLQARYLALRHPEAFQGCGAEPARLADLRPADLVPLPGCRVWVTGEENTFRGEMQPEDRCTFDYAGATRQVILGFTARAGEFLSYDRGIDSETGQATWGALLGPYQFEKRESYSWDKG